MSDEQLIERARAWVEKKSRELKGADVAVTPETDLLETGVLDSLSLVELVAFIEKATGRQIDLLTLEPEEFSTVRGLCNAATADSPRQDG